MSFVEKWKPCGLARGGGGGAFCGVEAARAGQSWGGCVLPCGRATRAWGGAFCGAVEAVRVGNPHVILKIPEPLQSFILQTPNPKPCESLNLQSSITLLPSHDSKSP